MFFRFQKPGKSCEFRRKSANFSVRPSLNGCFPLNGIAFKPGDIVAYRNSKGEILLGIVKSWNADGMVVERNEGADEARKMEEMVGMEVEAKVAMEAK